MYIKILTVSSLTNYIKKVLDNDFILNNANVKGELSNFKLHSSGHAYFSIKDDGAKMNCVMFKTFVQKLNFVPSDGMKVVIKGRISVYPKDGSYQLYCEEIVPEGMGELYIAFEKLKEKLKGEGLFDIEHKKPIPKYPKKIGVITSPTGAAIKDIINVTNRRNKNMNILIYPVLVQGINASFDIIHAIKAMDEMEDIDVIILARGGGSLEELWAFNDEQLARTVYECHKPIITGVGHEIDFTIVDFVSDRRAPTPSAAAEIAVPNLEDTLGYIVNIRGHIQNRIDGLLKDKFYSLKLEAKKLESSSPMQFIVNQYNEISNKRKTLDNFIQVKVSAEKERLIKNRALLNANNPLNVLERGYAVIEDENYNIISNIDSLIKKDQVNITLKDGKIKTKINIIK